jgi:hypothetical protein
MALYNLIDPLSIKKTVRYTIKMAKCSKFALFMLSLNAGIAQW